MILLQIIIQLFRDIWRGVPLGSQNRSGNWIKFRKENIGKECRACGEPGRLLKPLELHHIQPFNINPARECDKTNIITLCRKCHFLLAHLKNFKSYNINIKEDAKILRDKIRNRP